MEVISFGQKRTFTLKEANELLPIIYRLTETAHKEVRSLMNRLDAIKGRNLSIEKELEQQINQTVEKWQKKISLLGAAAKGLWLADFDNGEGYYCWKYPENKVTFFHGYNDGFSGRKRIEILENESEKFEI
jgi:hypothetical protein